MSTQALQDALQRMIDENTAAAYSKHPNHAFVVMRRMIGELQSMHTYGGDDPVLLAYSLRDGLKRMFGYMLELKQWSDTYIEATPDEVIKWSETPCH